MILDGDFTPEEFDKARRMEERFARRDPRRRPDRRCACGCGKPLPKRPDRAYASQAEFDRDPFATRECAERWHGVRGRPRGQVTV